jgi:hypothetical protein
MQPEFNIPARSPSRKILTPESANPLLVPAPQRLLLQRVKRALVALGGSGRRADFEFVKRAFAEIRDLRSA